MVDLYNYVYLMQSSSFIILLHTRLPVIYAQPFGSCHRINILLEVYLDTPCTIQIQINVDQIIYCMHVLEGSLSTKMTLYDISPCIG